jgi:acyl dehydratase
MLTFKDLPSLTAMQGEVLGVGPWHHVRQSRISEFAQATGDFQWIHTDLVRAADGKYGATVAHGYLVLSLIPLLAAEIFSLPQDWTRINYGIDKVRFPEAVRVDDQVQLWTFLDRVDLREQGAILKLRHEVRINERAKPGCVAETLTLLVL